jgi:hypothetical protein
MTHYTSITNQTLVEIGESWVQDNADQYAWTKIPKCRILGMAAGVGTTTYQLPALDNFLLKKDGMQEWGYGLARRAPRDLNKVPVSVTPSVQDITPLTRPMLSTAESESIWADLMSNIVPGQLALLYQGLEQKLAASVISDSFAQTKDFTGSVLDTYASNSNHDPIGDILVALEVEGLRWKKQATGGSLAMFISQRVIDLFQRHPAFSGASYAAAGSGVPQAVPRQAVFDHLRAILNVDEVIELSAVADLNDRLGQSTNDPNTIGRDVLAFHVLDRNKSRNLAANPFDTPEGSICLFEAEEPTVTMCEEADTKVVKFNGDAEFALASPRSGDFGIYFTTATMFT